MKTIQQILNHNLQIINIR
jgi:hypothetical protein